jgi:L-amino acid N-acyltransferase YncA
MKIATDMKLAIASMTSSDWDDVRRIYAEGIATGNATFATEAPSWESWDASHRKDCRLVARDDGSPRIVGWAALSRVSDRCVYGGVAEVSVYVAGSARGRGVGRALLEELVRSSEEAGLWTLQAGIFPENAASIALHHACGFRTVGIREKLGKMQRSGVWRDVALLERRSSRL